MRAKVDLELTFLDGAVERFVVGPGPTSVDVVPGLVGDRIAVAGARALDRLNQGPEEERIFLQAAAKGSRRGVRPRTVETCERQQVAAKGRA